MTQLELADQVRSVAADMRYSIAGGMSWISHSECDEFTARLDRIADRLATAESGDVHD